MTVENNKNGQTLKEATSKLLAERKLFGQILYDDLSAQIAIPYELDAEGMDKLIQQFEDAGVSVVDTDGGPTSRQLSSESAKEPEVEMTEDGYIKAGEDTRTSVPGVYVAGDCRVKDIRQVVTAVSDGAVAAIRAEKYIAEKFE